MWDTPPTGIKLPNSQSMSPGDIFSLAGYFLDSAQSDNPFCFHIKTVDDAETGSISLGSSIDISLSSLQTPAISKSTPPSISIPSALL
jgi:hypothetical protein